MSNGSQRSRQRKLRPGEASRRAGQGQMAGGSPERFALLVAETVGPEFQ